MLVIKIALPVLLFAVLGVLEFEIRIVYLNRFFERLADKHSETWERLGRPSFDRKWATPAYIIVLPYLYKRRYRKFKDDVLNQTGDVLRRLMITQYLVAPLFVLSVLNLLRV